MTIKEHKLKDWVRRVRESDTFGAGTCTTVDECMTDAELAATLSDFDTFEEAWSFLNDVEEVFWERAGMTWNPVREIV